MSKDEKNLDVLKAAVAKIEQERAADAAEAVAMAPKGDDQAKAAEAKADWAKVQPSFVQAVADFNAHQMSAGIEVQASVPNTPMPNGLVERHLIKFSKAPADVDQRINLALHVSIDGRTTYWIGDPDEEHPRGRDQEWTKRLDHDFFDVALGNLLRWSRRP